MKPNDPRTLAIDLLARSTCAVQVAAVVADNHGIFGWGWNSVGAGFGEHAEAAAIRRSSRKRMGGAAIYVASQRLRNGKTVMSLPCEECMCKIMKAHLGTVWFRDGLGEWVEV